MRFSTIFSLFLISASFSSCVKELIPEEVNTKDSEPESISVIYVSRESNVETKTSLSGIDVQFDAEDKILVIDKNGSNTETFTTASGTDSEGVATFTGNSIESTSFFGIYPYNSVDAAFDPDENELIATIPSEQEAVDGSFDPRANVSVARAVQKKEKDAYNNDVYNYYMTFKNVCCLLKFVITDENNADAIIVKGNNNEYLTGTVHIDPVTGKWDGIINGSKQVKLTPPDGGTKFPAGTYYVCILPQTFNKGVSVKIEHSLGSYHMRKGTVTQLSMNRSKIFQLFQGNLAPYTEVAMVPPLAQYNGNPQTNSAGQTFTLQKFSDVTRIEFITEAESKGYYQYASDNNMATSILAGSDVKAYRGNALGSASTTGSTLFIFTRLKAFSISDDNRSFAAEPASKLFNGYNKVTEIVGLNNIDVTFVKDYTSMFAGCNALNRIDISNWDTSSALTMGSMFNTNYNSALSEITLGEYFVLSNPGNNMFGPGTLERTNKITVRVPSNVDSQFEEIDYAAGNERYKKQVIFDKYYTGGAFTNITLGGGAPRYVDEGNYTEHTLSFELGGLDEAIEDLETINIGLIRFEPVDNTVLVYDTQAKYEGLEHAVYKYTVTQADKDAKSISVQVRTTARKKSEPKDGLGNIHLSASKFEDYDSNPYTIYNPEMIDLVSSNATCELSHDYTGQKCPIIGQSAKVTVKVLTSGLDPDTFNHLTINIDGDDILFDEVKSQSGYTVFTTHDEHVISSERVRKELTVTAHYNDHTKPLDTKAVVNVWGKELTVGTTPLTTVEQIAAQNENSSSATRKTWKGVVVQSYSDNTRYLHDNNGTLRLTNGKDDNNTQYFFQTDGSSYLRSFDGKYLPNNSLTLDASNQTLTISWHNNQAWLFSAGAVSSRNNKLQNNSGTLRWNSTNNPSNNNYRWNAYAVTLEYIAPSN